MKEYSDFKPVKLRLKIDLVLYPARAEELVNMIKAKVIPKLRDMYIIYIIVITHLRNLAKSLLYVLFSALLYRLNFKGIHFRKTCIKFYLSNNCVNVIYFVKP